MRACRGLKGGGDGAQKSGLGSEFFRRDVASSVAWGVDLGNSCEAVLSVLVVCRLGLCV